AKQAAWPVVSFARYCNIPSYKCENGKTYYHIGSPDGTTNDRYITSPGMPAPIIESECFGKDALNVSKALDLIISTNSQERNLGVEYLGNCGNKEALSKLGQVLLAEKDEE